MMDSGPIDELLASLKWLHKLNGDPQEYSDVVIHSAAERPYYVHRAIVCPRSEYLSKKCLPITEKPKDEADALLLQDNSVTLDPRDETDTTKPKGKRNKTKLKHKPETTEPKGETDTVKPKEETDLSKSTDETDTSNIRFEIDLTDDDKVAVQLTVEYLYFLDYARPKPDVELETHAKVYMHAAKYQIEQLKVMALAKFIKAAEVTADKPWNADGFVSATKTVYDGPGADAELHKGLRSAVITILLAHKELFQQDNMKKVMEGDHQLCYDLIMRLVGCESE